MADIVYTWGATPYLNITNECPCACVFCIRGGSQGVGSAHSLWHQADPTWEEIELALERFDFSHGKEAVFCGYGEPLCALEHLKRAAQWLKDNYPGLRLRLNTNGLGNLIHGRPVACELAGLIDAVSVSLNAPNAARYHALVQSCYGEAAYAAMLQFAAQAQRCLPEVQFSVVDVLAPEELAQCRAIAAEMGIPLRVRHKE
jgi:TatD family-associated radical SAM protein